ncbi:MAG: ABC transporter ATP-binding protein [Puniceicoccales bacterium]|jgi:iron complex transport system ATP-binding protein|nr:ABC transporter ATP-binding protein [Puniceicoccales bacterium]
MPEKTLLELQDVSVHGRLNKVSLRLQPGQLAGLIGPNGSGKSTLLQAAAGVLPHDGHVLWQGRELAHIPFMERGRIATWVPQDAHFEFGFKVRSVVAQGRFAHDDDASGVEDALCQLELAELAARPVNQLSGGERQRVLLARALATNAPLQLWDEPLASLDPRHVLDVLGIARKLAQRQGAAILFALHDLSLALELDWLAVLHNGQLRASGAPKEVLSRELLGEVFRVRANRREGFALEKP